MGYSLFSPETLLNRLHLAQGPLRNLTECPALTQPLLDSPYVTALSLS